MDSANLGTPGSIPWKEIAIGFFITALVAAYVWLVMSRSSSRPMVQGFYAPPTVGAAIFPCAGLSSEAAALIGMFDTNGETVGEEAKQNLSDLRNLVTKLCCMKQDLMGVSHSVSAVKELQFHTFQDIQPVADMTARCFAKTIPERDLDIQFGKWRDAGKDLLRRLCTAYDMTEDARTKAEGLFMTAWKDVYAVARLGCLQGPVDGAFKTGPHEPAARAPEEITYLREYDGNY
jgi:hypothetical protein